MKNLRNLAVRKAVLCLIAPVALCISVGTTASAQKMMTSSAWRSVTVDSGTIPARTTIKVTTTEPIDSRECAVFHAVVARNVIGSRGQVLINKGSDAELAVRHTPEGETVVDLVSVTINGQVFRPEWPTRGGEAGPNVAKVVGTGACLSRKATIIEVPRNSLLTFRLIEPLVVG